MIYHLPVTYINITSSNIRLFVSVDFALKEGECSKYKRLNELMSDNMLI